jgi:cysteine desulfurase
VSEPSGTLTYLDHAATTPLRPEVAEAMAAVHAEPLGNPTGTHPLGQRARRLLEEARDEVAAFAGCEPGEVIFTSGGTESANLAVFGTLGALVQAVGDGAMRPVLLPSAVEHPAVLESCRAAARSGLAEVHELAVDEMGRLSPATVRQALERHDGVGLVALMLANNETGVLEPVTEVATLVAEMAPGAVVFTDAVQGAAFLDIGVATANAGLVGLSAHKVGGPVGTGALVVRAPATVAAALHGGGQERERRSGTQDVAGAVGLATALRLAQAERSEVAARVAVLRDRLADGLLSSLAEAHRTVAAGTAVLPGHLHLCLAGIEREELLVALGRVGICASAGSSCASGALEPSHVLSAMAVPDVLAAGAVRFTLGTGTTEAEVARALALVPDVVGSLAPGRLAPLTD